MGDSKFEALRIKARAMISDGKLPATVPIHVIGAVYLRAMRSL